MNSLIIVNAETVAAVVNSTNSFTAEFMANKANRALVTAARADKKARLGALTPSQIGTLIEADGLILTGEKRRTLKSGEGVVTLTFRKAVSEVAAVEKEIAALNAKLAALTKNVTPSGTADTTTNVLNAAAQS